MTFDNLSPREIPQFLKKEFGPLWITLEPELILNDLVDKGNIDTFENKFRAVRAILLADGPFTDWHIFTPIIVALNGITPDFTITTPPTLDLLIKGLYELHMLRELPFSDEIKSYLAVLLLHNGVFKAPNYIPVQKEIDDIIGNNYKPESKVLNNQMLELMSNSLMT